MGVSAICMVLACVLVLCSGQPDGEPVTEVSTTSSETLSTTTTMDVFAEPTDGTSTTAPATTIASQTTTARPTLAPLQGCVLVAPDTVAALLSCSTESTCRSLFVSELLDPFVTPNATRAAAASETVLDGSFELLIRARISLLNARTSGTIEQFRAAIKEYMDFETAHARVPEGMRSLDLRWRKFFAAAAQASPPRTTNVVWDSVSAKFAAGLVLQISALRSIPCAPQSPCSERQRSLIRTKQSQLVIVLGTSARPLETLLPLQRVVLPLLCPSQCSQLACVSNIITYMGPLMLSKFNRTAVAIVAYYALRQAAGNAMAARNFSNSVADVARALQGNISASLRELQQATTMAETIDWVRTFLNSKYNVCGERKWCVEVVSWMLRDELQEALRRWARVPAQSLRAIGPDGADDDASLGGRLLALRDQFVFFADPLQRPSIFVFGLVVSCLLLIACIVVFLLAFKWRVHRDNLRLMLVLIGGTLTVVLRLIFWCIVARDYTSRRLPDRVRIYVQLAGNFTVPLVLVETMLVFLWLWLDAVVLEQHSATAVKQVGAVRLTFILFGVTLAVVGFVLGIGALIQPEVTVTQGTILSPWYAGARVYYILLVFLPVVLTALLLGVTLFALNRLSQNNRDKRKTYRPFLRAVRRMSIILCVMIGAFVTRTIIVFVDEFATDAINPYVKFYIGVALCETVILGAILYFIVSTFYHQHIQNTKSMLQPRDQPSMNLDDLADEDGPGAVEFIKRDDLRASLLERTSEKPDGFDYQY